MIWDQDVKLIVMLCKQESETNNECIDYWTQDYQRDDYNITITKYEETTERFKEGGIIIKRILFISDRKTERKVE